MWLSKEAPPFTEVWERPEGSGLLRVTITRSGNGVVVREVRTGPLSANVGVEYVAWSVAEVKRKYGIALV